MKQATRCTFQPHHCWVSSLISILIITCCCNVRGVASFTSPPNAFLYPPCLVGCHHDNFLKSPSRLIRTRVYDLPPTGTSNIKPTETVDNGVECSLDDEKCLDEKKRDKKIQIRVDGLEPYVLVSAITSTSSFEVLVGGNIFSSGDVYDGTIAGIFKLLLLTSTLCSSVLGLYALGIFSFCILYSKAALARDEDDSTDIYESFFTITSKLRYRGFVMFLRSLELFVLNCFLYTITYLPQDVQLIAGLVSAISVYFVLKDWREIVDAAGMIYQPSNSSSSSKTSEESAEHTLSIAEKSFIEVFENKIPQ